MVPNAGRSPLLAQRGLDKPEFVLPVIQAPGAGRLDGDASTARATFHPSPRAQAGGTRPPRVPPFIQAPGRKPGDGPHPKHPPQKKRTRGLGKPRVRSGSRSVGLWGGGTAAEEILLFCLRRGEALLLPPPDFQIILQGPGPCRASPTFFFHERASGSAQSRQAAQVSEQVSQTQSGGFFRPLADIQFPRENNRFSGACRVG